jgi:hypothetical protein
MLFMVKKPLAESAGRSCKTTHRDRPVEFLNHGGQGVQGVFSISSRGEAWQRKMALTCKTYVLNICLNFPPNPFVKVLATAVFPFSPYG